jgi:hypothetical protein
MTRLARTGALGLALFALAASRVAAEERLTFDDNQWGGIRPVNGRWFVESGQLRENSDSPDERGRPFFAVLPRVRADNLTIAADLAFLDGLGEALLCPAWKDADNYIAAEWLNSDTVRLLHVREGRETILAEAKLKDVKPPLRLGVAIAGLGVRAFVNGVQVLEGAAFFEPAPQAALGSRDRRPIFDNLSEQDVAAWSVDRAGLCPLVLERGSGRGVFYRLESGATTSITVRNISAEPLSAVKVTVACGPGPAVEQTLASLAANASTVVPCAVAADRLRPDQYELVAEATVVGYRNAQARFPVHIVPRPNPGRLPVLMWGSIPTQGAAKLAELGFTAVFAGGADYSILDADPEAKTVLRRGVDQAQILAGIEDAMRAGLEVGGSFDAGHYLINRHHELRRVDRAGKAGQSEDICPLLPAAQQFMDRAATAYAATYRQYPAFRFALINTEVRDGANLCFHAEDSAACRAATGADVPALATTKWGVGHQTIPGFPGDRVVSDDDPLLRYFAWFWKQGDGWVQVNSLVHERLRAGKEDGFFTWTDPAVRVAPVYGSGGMLDMIGQWTYTYPDPIRVGLSADELLNMAQGKQRVFQMVQAIWYRSQTAPKAKRAAVDRRQVSDPWDDHDPDADYITPSPTHLTEGCWTALSRPVGMIGYHGLEALLAGNSGGYRYTHPDAAGALARVHRELVQPFGPMLREIGNRPADVALLESFAAQVFAGRATYGWAGGTIGAAWHACQYAGLQMDIIYDESVRAGALERYKVLVLPDADVLTRAVVERVRAFQQRGGIVIADERLTPALKADIVLPVNEAANAEHKAKCLEVAALLRVRLAGRFVPFALSANPQVVLHTRQRGEVQYLFAINDQRDFGDYVGTYGLVQEIGLPAQTSLAIQRAGVKVIDLLAGREVSTREEAGVTHFDAALEPGGGALFVIVERLPTELALGAPAEVARGSQAAFEVELRDDRGATPVVVPFELEILDPARRVAEPSGQYAALDGRAKVIFDLAENERTGVWQVRVHERLTKRSLTRYFTVK